jgi:hypothetical protein
MSERINLLLQWWWGLWLVAQAEARYARAETIDDLRTTAVFYVAWDATSTVAGILAILVVIRLSRRIHARATESGLNPGPP